MCRAIDGFVKDKEESSLEITEPVPIKARDPSEESEKRFARW